MLPKKRKKKSPLQKLHDRCWAMARKVIYLRDHGQCQHCYKRVEGANAHTSHVLPKSVGGGVRYDLLNLKLLCYHCHINWWHKSPAESGEWFRTNFPERWQYIEKIPRLRSYRISDLQEILEELQIEYEKLFSGGT